MKLFQQFRHLRKKPYWGNHFWAKGYCVDTVGMDADMIRKYVRYQECCLPRKMDFNSLIIWATQADCHAN